ncbi:hypothetical protein BC834DRAFT_923422 [Gloeopeniophorella convolvens]|nr:hypothetical protein BC834DRAFT_923422 [Gloeopeniophorella convolvens]
MQVLRTVRGSFSGGPRLNLDELPDLKGKTVLVAGDAQSIVYDVAKALAQAHARTLVLAPNSEEGLAKIRESPPDADVRFLECNFQTLAEVRAAGDGIVEEEDRLDISGDNVEKEFAAHLASVVLVNRILPILRSTARSLDTSPPRVVWAASAHHADSPATVKFASPDEINNSVDYSFEDLVARAQLAGVLWMTSSLTNRVLRHSGDRILALAVYAHGDAGILGRKQTHDAQSAVWAATAPEIAREGRQGRYFENPGVLGKESEAARDEELGDALWVLDDQMVRSILGDDALHPWDIGLKGST